MTDVINFFAAATAGTMAGRLIYDVAKNALDNRHKWLCKECHFGIASNNLEFVNRVKVDHLTKHSI